MTIYFRHLCLDGFVFLDWGWSWLAGAQSKIALIHCDQWSWAQLFPSYMYRRYRISRTGGLGQILEYYLDSTTHPEELVHRISASSVYLDFSYLTSHSYAQVLLQVPFSCLSDSSWFIFQVVILYWFSELYCHQSIKELLAHMSFCLNSSCLCAVGLQGSLLHAIFLL